MRIANAVENDDKRFFAFFIGIIENFSDGGIFEIVDDCGNPLVSVGICDTFHFSAVNFDYRDMSVPCHAADFDYRAFPAAL